jgi:MFS family permease
MAAGLLALLGMRAIVGIAEAGGGPASLSLLSSIIPSQRRGNAIGIFMLANAAGTILTFRLAGFLVAHYGWRAAFFVAGVAGLLLAIVMRTTLHDLDRRLYGDAIVGRASALRVLGRLVRHPVLRQLALGSALATALMVGLWVWAAAFFVRVYGVTLPNAGLIVATGAGLCAGGGTMIAGWLTDRADTVATLRIPIWALALLTGCCLAITVAASLSVAICTFVLASFVAPMFLAPSYSAILSLVEPSERGMALAGVQMATSVLGSALGPAIVGIISGISGSLTTALMVLAAAGPIAALLFAKARRSIEIGTPASAA